MCHPDFIKTCGLCIPSCGRIHLNSPLATSYAVDDGFSLVSQTVITAGALVFLVLALIRRKDVWVSMLHTHWMNCSCQYLHCYLHIHAYIHVIQISISNNSGLLWEHGRVTFRRVWLWVREVHNILTLPLAVSTISILQGCFHSDALLHSILNYIILHRMTVTLSECVLQGMIARVWPWDIPTYAYTYVYYRESKWYRVTVYWIV